MGQILGHPLVLAVLLASLLILIYNLSMNWLNRKRMASEMLLPYTGQRVVASEAYHVSATPLRRAVGTSTAVFAAPPPVQRTEIVISGRKYALPFRVEIVVKQALTAFLEGSFEVSYSSFMLGRDGYGHLNFDNDPTVSRHHSEIYFDEDKNIYYLRDMDSKYGTVVSGKTVTPGQSVILADQSQIQLGQTVHIEVRISPDLATKPEYSDVPRKPIDSTDVFEF